jgi:Tol biopolymer transport system component
MRRLTFGGKNMYPMWTPDGERIVFRSDREGDQSLFWQRADGSGPAERLTRSEKATAHVPDLLLPDGKILVFQIRGSGEGSLWMLSLDGDRKPKPLILPVLSSANLSNSALSPDAHWIAYHSNESGRTEVYVQPFPPTGAKYQVTTIGGSQPLWSPDGKELFYLEGLQQAGSGNRIISVEIQTRPTFAIGKATLPCRSKES